MAEIRGEIVCNSCGNIAALKQIKNSANLYMHCKECGCDRRTGKGIQKKWQNAIAGIMPDLPENNPETKSELSEAETLDAPEWKPTPQVHGRELPENSRDISDNPERITAHKVAAGAVFSLAFAGFIYNIVKTIRS